MNLGDTTEKGITFYAKDLTNDDEPMQSVQIAHTVASGIANETPLVIGGLGAGNGNLFDGLIDDVRISDTALKNEELLFTSPRPASTRWAIGNSRPRRPHTPTAPPTATTSPPRSRREK